MLCRLRFKVLARKVCRGLSFFWSFIHQWPGGERWPWTSRKTIPGPGAPSHCPRGSSHCPRGSSHCPEVNESHWSTPLPFHTHIPQCSAELRHSANQRESTHTHTHTFLPLGKPAPESHTSTCHLTIRPVLQDYFVITHYYTVKPKMQSC